MCDMVTRIRDEMKELGMKQKDLIEYLDEKQSNVSKYLSLNDNIRLDIPNTTLAKIAAFIDVDVEYLLCLQDEKRKAISNDNIITAEIMSVKASAGEGNHTSSIDNFSTGRTAVIDNCFFKSAPPRGLKAMQVDGYSMIPMLFPDSWVIYREVDRFETDGLYIINYGDELMVKMLQINPEKKMIDIISTNKEYKSYSIDPDDQSIFVIVGRVIRSII